MKGILLDPPKKPWSHEYGKCGVSQHQIAFLWAFSNFSMSGSLGEGEKSTRHPRIPPPWNLLCPRSSLGQQCPAKYSALAGGLASGWVCSAPQPLSTDPKCSVFADCRLHICLYYREILVKELTTASPEGCRISHGHTYDASNLDQVLFPYPEDNGQRKNIEKLLSHLERGVVLWMAPDGLYAKRLCQSRIYWDGPLALCSDRPNKLERDQTCKLFDTQQFLSGNAPNYWLEQSAPDL